MAMTTSCGRAGSSCAPITGDTVCSFLAHYCSPCHPLFSRANADLMIFRLRVCSRSTYLRTRDGDGADGWDGQPVNGLDAAEGDEQHAKHYVVRSTVSASPIGCCNGRGDELCGDAPGETVE